MSQLATLFGGAFDPNLRKDQTLSKAAKKAVSGSKDLSADDLHLLHLRDHKRIRSPEDTKSAEVIDILCLCFSKHYHNHGTGELDRKRSYK